MVYLRSAFHYRNAGFPDVQCLHNVFAGRAAGVSRRARALESTFPVARIGRQGYSGADVPPRFHRWVEEQPNPHNKKGGLCREGKCSLMSGCHQRSVISPCMRHTCISWLPRRPHHSHVHTSNIMPAITCRAG